MGMTYDYARDEVVLFGDTWTWDGTTWTQEPPATSPSARSDMGMAYDQARGEVVVFGGYGPWPTAGRHLDLERHHLEIPLKAGVKHSHSGPPGTAVQAGVIGFAAFEQVKLVFVDSVTGKTLLGTFTTGTGKGTSSRRSGSH